jgi:hypothetical protein
VSREMSQQLAFTPPPGMLMSTTRLSPSLILPARPAPTRAHLTGSCWTRSSSICCHSCRSSRRRQRPRR